MKIHYLNYSCSEADNDCISNEYYQHHQSANLQYVTCSECLSNRQSELDIIEDHYEKLFDKVREKERNDRFRDKWSYRNRQYHNIGDYSVWTIADRIAKQFVGKSANDAFSKYCSIVKIYQQSLFFRYIVDPHAIYHKYIHRNHNYYVDEDGNIAEYDNTHDKSSVYKVLSWDYKAEWQYIAKTFLKIHIKRNYEKHLVITSGEVFEFAEKGNEFKRCSTEQRKKKLLAQKKGRKQAELYKQTLLKKIVAERAAKEKLANDIKIISHGFDLKTSFRNM